MLSNRVSLIFFLLVAGAHIGALATAILSSSKPKPVEVVTPTIQGVLIMADPKESVPLPIEAPSPPPEKKPVPKPALKPPPKAPASERAVKVPEPEPVPAVVQPEIEPAMEQMQPAKSAPAPVTPPQADAEGLNNPAPIYPSLSRRLREQGSVILAILIRADGSVGKIRIKRSSGHKRLDDTAIKAVKRWRYLPATQGGKAIDYWYEQPLEFNLH
jgi:periplasmic protein TonB